MQRPSMSVHRRSAASATLFPQEGDFVLPVRQVWGLPGIPKALRISLREGQLSSAQALSKAGHVSGATWHVTAAAWKRQRPWTGMAGTGFLQHATHAGQSPISECGPKLLYIRPQEAFFFQHFCPENGMRKSTVPQYCPALLSPCPLSCTWLRLDIPCVTVSCALCFHILCPVSFVLMHRMGLDAPPGGHSVPPLHGSVHQSGGELQCAGVCTPHHDQYQYNSTVVLL